MRIAPIRTKKNPLFIRVHRNKPTQYSPLPMRKLTLSPMESIIKLAGKLLNEYTRKEAVMGALT